MNIYRTSFLFGNSVSVTVIFVILLTMLIASIIKILFCIFAIVDLGIHQHRLKCFKLYSRKSILAGSSPGF